MPMDVACLRSHCITSSPLRSSSPRPPCALPRARVSVSIRRSPRRGFLGLCSLRRRLCCASGNLETLVAGLQEDEDEDEDEKHGGVLGVREEEFGDLKSWMHENGLPPCKVVLKERPSHNEKHKPIHYVAASEDLQVIAQIVG